ncbi:MAG: VCBS repeat-containing protein, partial [Nanoarchaeota archaeon]
MTIMERADANVFYSNTGQESNLEKDTLWRGTNETHLECVDGACIPLNGAGPDQCTNDSSCQNYSNTTHFECVNQQCIALVGEGQDECVSDENCTIPFQPGWPQTMNGPSSSSPVCADINNDGLQEIVVVNSWDSNFNTNIYVWDANGNLLDHWPIQVDEYG